MQLANGVPTINRHVCEAIAEGRNIASQPFREQWHQLVLRPLSKLDGSDSHWPYILVVDARDGCDDENNIRIILQLLAEVRSLKMFNCETFSVASWPEEEVVRYLVQYGRDLFIWAAPAYRFISNGKRFAAKN